MSNTQQQRWWHGARGEWYVVVQFALLLLILYGPRSFPGEAQWSSAAPQSSHYIGVTLLIAGITLAAYAAFALGRNLTPLPKPGNKATLVVRGPYRLVRHPIYSGLILTILGYALLHQSFVLIAYWVVTFIFFDIKSRREEMWLTEKFADYSIYRVRVRKLIPWIY